MPRRGENIHKRKDGRWEARYKKEGNNVAFFYSQRSKCVGSIIYPGHQLPKRNVPAVVVQCRCIQTILVAFKDIVVCLAAGHRGILRFLGIVFHPYFFLRNLHGGLYVSHVSTPFLGGIASKTLWRASDGVAMQCIYLRTLILYRNLALNASTFS